MNRLFRGDGVLSLRPQHAQPYPGSVELYDVAKIAALRHGCRCRFGVCPQKGVGMFYATLDQYQDRTYRRYPCACKHYFLGQVVLDESHEQAGLSRLGDKDSMQPLDKDMIYFHGQRVHTKVLIGSSTEHAEKMGTCLPTTPIVTSTETKEAPADHVMLGILGSLTASLQHTPNKPCSSPNNTDPPS